MCDNFAFMVLFGVLILVVICLIILVFNGLDVSPKNVPVGSEWKLCYTPDNPYKSPYCLFVKIRSVKQSNNTGEWWVAYSFKNSEGKYSLTEFTIRLKYFIEIYEKVE